MSEEAAKALLAEHGLVAVPVEPGYKLFDAMMEAWFSGYDKEGFDGYECYLPAYKAMIAAAQDK